MRCVTFLMSEMLRSLLLSSNRSLTKCFKELIAISTPTYRLSPNKNDNDKCKVNNDE